MKLSTKVMIVVPLILVAGAVSEYLNYYYQTKQTLEQAQDAASVQSMIIRESLVNMMITNQRVDDDYLARINNVGDVQNLHVWFMLDNLHLRREFLTSERIERLKEREHRETRQHSDDDLEILSTGKAVWTSTDERLEAVIPFKAETKCQRCHDVPIGHVLGAAHMEISLSKASLAMRENAKHSAWIFIIFTIIAIVIDAVIFRKFVARPVQKLLQATEVLGTGNLDHTIEIENPNDELGKLATSFNEMQQKLKQAQLELIHKERLSTVGQMASSIIHDFRSPMNAILLGVSVLQENKNLSDQRRKHLLNNILAVISRMNRMAQELLDFSRGEIRLDVRKHDVAEFSKTLAAEVSNNLQRKQVRFAAQSRYVGKAWFDWDRMYRALINIINNAEDALGDGGEIQFETRIEEGNIVWRISDTGDGIPDPVRDRIFEPFVTAGKTSGTGLGLAITKRIVEEHKGEISFETKKGKGTTFTVRIPSSLLMQ